MLEKSVKIFKNGRNQAVRLPRDLEFKGVDEVLIRKEGGSLVITPARQNWVSFAKLPKADDDFLVNRADVFNQERIKF